MIFSKSSEYAIRAFLYLADREPGKLVMAKQIADEAGLPAHFLAKLLQQLARKGLVKSNKGPSGGFTLGMPAKEITLFRIVEAVEGVETSTEPQAVNGNGDSHSLTQDGWIEVRSRIVDYLERTSLASIHRTVATTKKKKVAAVR
ncbi:MAG: Rrf2 family transcriptional regulator [Acidobacteria bacterium]|nr:Rrf2 family transcriptional regulator [Acidobacteriota bacterium]